MSSPPTTPASASRRCRRATRKLAKGPSLRLSVRFVDHDHSYTFAALADTTTAFLTKLGLVKVALYIFDYGAPVGLRMALSNKIEITAIVSQNGNCYVEGLGAQRWTVIRRLWDSSNSSEERKRLRDNALTIEGMKSQYTGGVAEEFLPRIAPETWTLNYAHMALTPDNWDVQLDLLYDYRTNVDMYPQFQKWLREMQVPLLAVWGRNDVSFIPPGAEAFKKDLKGAQVHFVDSGHFALETHLEEIVGYMLPFLKEHLTRA